MPGYYAHIIKHILLPVQTEYAGFQLLVHIRIHASHFIAAGAMEMRLPCSSPDEKKQIYFYKLFVF